MTLILTTFTFDINKKIIFLIKKYLLNDSLAIT